MARGGQYAGPTEILGCRGDVLLAHYLLGHNIEGNIAPDRTRRALYWRLRGVGHGDRWAECLADEWQVYHAVRRVLAQAVRPD